MDSNEILAVVESVSTEKGLEDSIIYFFSFKIKVSFRSLSLAYIDAKTYNNELDVLKADKLFICF